MNPQGVPVKRSFVITSVLVAALSVGVAPAPGTNFTFSGARFNDPDDWSPAGGPPGASDIANYGGSAHVIFETNATTNGHFVGTGNVTFLLGQTTQTVIGNGLRIGLGAGEPSSLTLLNGTMTGSLVMAANWIARVDFPDAPRPMRTTRRMLTSVHRRSSEITRE